MCLHVLLHCTAEKHTDVGQVCAGLGRIARTFSGGELQRFCIARALAARPRYLIADEISTMLDALTQAQIWHVLLEESAAHNMGVILVSHSPSLTERVATRIAKLG